MCPFFTVLVRAALEVMEVRVLESLVGSLLGRVLQCVFRQCLHGRLRAVTCYVGELPHCFGGVRRPW